MPTRVNPNNWNEAVRKALNTVILAAWGLYLAFNPGEVPEVIQAALSVFAGAVWTLFWSIFPGFNTVVGDIRNMTAKQFRDLIKETAGGDK